MTATLSEAKTLQRWREASRLALEADPVEVMRFWIASHRPTLIPHKLSRAIAAYGLFPKQIGRAASF